ncbi:hypothetical protein DFS33DRAFT_1454915 [Desarmillaria ectypa]|nr:hypothetical protein DFS33DRAFT_1454915 [Desarmillaria ectypa]
MLVLHSLEHRIMNGAFTVLPMLFFINLISRRPLLTEMKFGQSLLTTAKSVGFTIKGTPDSFCDGRKTFADFCLV